jgi:ribosome-associated toxin RatA of RatAB toxin-antitoxin module
MQTQACTQIRVPTEYDILTPDAARIRSNHKATGNRQMSEFASGCSGSKGNTDIRFDQKHRSRLRNRFVVDSQSLHNRMQMLLNSFTINLNSLRKHRAKVALSLRYHFTIVEQSLHNRFTIASQLLYNSFTIVAESLHHYFTVVAQSLHNRFTVVAQSLLSHCAIDGQTKRKRSTIVAQSLYNRFAIASQSRRNSFTAVAQSLLIHCALLKNHTHLQQIGGRHYRRQPVLHRRVHLIASRN